MPEPMEGQPFLAYPGLRISVGDLGAALGTDARRSVTILEAGVPSPIIISSGDHFNVQVQVRTAQGGVPFPFPASLVTDFHVHDLFTGDPVAGSPFTGGAPAVLAAPAGDSGPGGAFDRVTWYSVDSPSLSLPDGTYRITIHGRTTPAEGIMFIHDGTIIQVGM